MCDNNSILFYDSEYTGHHSEYVKHLLKYLNKSTDNNCCFYFVLNNKVVEDVCENSLPTNVQLISIDKKFQLENPTGFNGLKRAKAELTCLNHYCSHLKIVKCFLLNINPFISIGMLPWFNFKCQNIQGIHFHPYYRMVVYGVKDKIKFQLKRQILKTFSNRKNIKSIFILNDAFVCEELNIQFKHHNKFQPLADPVNIEMKQVINSTLKKKNRLLFWGYINKRKGIHNALEAICLLTKDERSKFDVMIAGKVDEEYRSSLVKKIETTRNICPEVDIILKEGFVSNEEIPNLISESDLIMAPYTKMEGSSGLLGWAAAFNKTILGPSGGLIGELIKQFKLGITVDSDDTNSILEGLRKYNNDDFIVKREGQEDYLKLNSPKKFSEKILNSLLK